MLFILQYAPLMLRQVPVKIGVFFSIFLCLTVKCANIDSFDHIHDQNIYGMHKNYEFNSLLVYHDIAERQIVLKKIYLNNDLQDKIYECMGNKQNLVNGLLTQLHNLYCKNVYIKIDNLNLNQIIKLRSVYNKLQTSFCGTFKPNEQPAKENVYISDTLKDIIISLLYNNSKIAVLFVFKNTELSIFNFCIESRKLFKIDNSKIKTNVIYQETKHSIVNERCSNIEKTENLGLNHTNNTAQDNSFPINNFEDNFDLNIKIDKNDCLKYNEVEKFYRKVRLNDQIKIFEIAHFSQKHLILFLQSDDNQTSVAGIFDPHIKNIINIQSLVETVIRQVQSKAFENYIDNLKRNENPWTNTNRTENENSYKATNNCNLTEGSSCVQENTHKGAKEIKRGNFENYYASEHYRVISEEPFNNNLSVCKVLDLTKNRNILSKRIKKAKYAQYSAKIMSNQSKIMILHHTDRIFHHTTRIFHHNNRIVYHNNQIKNLITRQINIKTAEISNNILRNGKNSSQNQFDYVQRNIEKHKQCICEKYLYIKEDKENIEKEKEYIIKENVKIVDEQIKINKFAHEILYLKKKYKDTNKKRDAQNSCKN